MLNNELFADKTAVICVGLPACGKTTYWKKYYPHYELLDSYNELKDITKHDISKLSYENYKNLLKLHNTTIKKSYVKKIKSAKEAGKGVFFADCNLVDEDRVKLIKYLQDLGFRVIVIWFDVDPVTCKERNKKKSNTRKRVYEKDIIKYCKDYVFIKYGKKLQKEKDELGYRLIITR